MLHYLRAIKQAGTTEAKAAVRQSKTEPIKDAVDNSITIRERGHVIRDMHYLNANSPSGSKHH